ncbi:MAG: fumarylacetoacetate hydrolase family protein [Paludibacter sp.]|jgi:2-keto-4-pentenoate hydratase/2-oxohepta-3-ene-1,7-dioic acid hydratase in catechol pathway|nr:fumarylacetoacetate hydrolase family protein [Paludibacter sp.]
MKIFAIGQNYVEHNKELSQPNPAEPIIFMKPDTALLRENKPFYIPDFSKNLHYETEILIKICKLGKNIAPRFAYRYYNEIGLGIDFTARDVQKSLREAGYPWEICKAFDNSAVVGRFLPKEQFADVQDIKFHLDINEKTVQQGCTANMIFTVDKIISHISRYFTLKMGDIIFTGTPAGVGAVHEGDRLQGYIGDEKMFDFKIK